MKKNVIVMIVGMLLLSSFTVTHTFGETSSRSTLYVGGSGPGNYSSIQDAIDDANNGDTIFVYNGTYYEHVVVNKSINLIGDDKETTIILCDNQDVVNISADNINLSGFTIRDAGYHKQGILILSNYNNVSGNIITNNMYGLRIRGSAHHNIVSGNNISGDNDVGIILGKPSDNNTITGNMVKNNDYCGVYIDLWSRDNIISYNIISGNYKGIEIMLSSYNHVFNNTISDNEYGIHIVQGSPSSTGNVFYHNNFVNNSVCHANDPSDNQWDNGYSSGGNYWDDYIGIDSDDDRIGDTPYNISGGDSQDRYPLMYPWGEILPVADFSYISTGLKTEFNASLSYDRDGIIVNYTWDFDDGNISYEQNPQHKYADDGDYEVTLTVTDNKDLTDSITKNVEVTNAPPVANFTYTVDGLSVAFDASSSYDPDGTITNYTWDFGDGNTSEEKNPEHTYAEEYTTYRVNLTVTDDKGKNTTVSKEVTTGDITPPTIHGMKPERALYINNEKKRSRLFRMTFIIGDITIGVNATDEGSKIKQVNFYIDPLRSLGRPVGNDTTPPYTYNWTKNRLVRFFHIHVLKVEVIDNAGNIATKTMIVRKIL